MKADETKRKREILLGINPCIYGLNYHDPAVVVLIDGRVVFGVEEERCNRVKHSKGVFPSLALAECLTYCNLTWDDIDAVVIGYEPALWMNRLNLELLDIINPFVSCVSNSIQIRGSEIVEKIIRTNIVDRYTFFRSQENVRKLIIEKCSALETTSPLTRSSTALRTPSRSRLSSQITMSRLSTRKHGSVCRSYASSENARTAMMKWGCSLVCCSAPTAAM